MNRAIESVFSVVVIEGCLVSNTQHMPKPAQLFRACVLLGGNTQAVLEHVYLPILHQCLRCKPHHQSGQQKQKAYHAGETVPYRCEFLSSMRMALLLFQAPRSRPV